jgi:excisionase family DNA binding protein
MTAEDLLDIKAAAALLKVSETSLRRWTNSGLLKCYRVGGRKERRFRRSDLLAFLDSHSKRATVASLEAGHYCGFYSSDRTRAQQTARFLAAALGGGGDAFVSARPAVRQAVLRDLVNDYPQLREAAEGPRVSYVDFAEGFDAQYGLIANHLSEAAAKGAHTMYVFGDVSGGSPSLAPFEDIIRFENALDTLYHGQPDLPTVLCLYDARHFTGEQTVALLHAHPDTLRAPLTVPPA